MTFFNFMPVTMVLDISDGTVTFDFSSVIPEIENLVIYSAIGH
jgi:hypothetical protein